MKGKDKGRKWMWWLLGGIASVQFYFVQELLAAFALFVLGFLAIASVVGSFYGLYRVWAVAVDRVADSQHPVIVGLRRGIDGIGDLARRPFRRPSSEQPAS
jgi:hypothetical protein